MASIPVSEIWVVDNGSLDRSVDVASSAQQALSNLRIFVNSENISLGGTHKAVFRKAKENGFTHVVVLHGDDQASPDEINSLIIASVRTAGATVLGSRFMKGATLQGYDFKRVAGNKVLNFVYSIFARRKLTDLGSGLNLFRVSDLAPETYMGFGNSLSFNYELMLDFIQRGVPFSYVPITWREEDQTSNARNIQIFIEAIRILIRWVLHRPKSRAELLAESFSWKEVR